MNHITDRVLNAIGPLSRRQYDMFPGEGRQRLNKHLKKQSKSSKQNNAKVESTF
jgi:hypothetical protein